MKTLTQDNITVNASTIEEGLALVDAIERLNASKQHREYLASTEHGHDFSEFTRRCKRCEMSRKDYLVQMAREREPCPGPPLTLAPPDPETRPYSVYGEVITSS